MILDIIDNASCYAGIFPKVDLILQEMKKYSVEGYPQGKKELEGASAFLLFKEYQTHEKDDALFEAHRAYIDVMYMVDGEETIYVKPTDSLRAIEKPYDEASDALLGKLDDDCTPVLLKAGMFIILFPQDAHAPACHVSQKAAVKKIIGKVRLD